MLQALVPRVIDNSADGSQLEGCPTCMHRQRNLPKSLFKVYSSRLIFRTSFSFFRKDPSSCEAASCESQALAALAHRWLVSKLEPHAADASTAWGSHGGSDIEARTVRLEELMQKTLVEAKWRLTLISITYAYHKMMMFVCICLYPWFRK